MWVTSPRQSRAGYRGGLLGDRAAEPGRAVSAAEDQAGDGEPGQLAGRDVARGVGEVVGQRPGQRLQRGPVGRGHCLHGSPLPVPVPLRGARNADQVALGVGEVTDHQACRGAFWSHLALAAEPLGFSQGGLDVGHADVEDDVGRVAGASPDAAGNPGSAGAVTRSTKPWSDGSDMASATGELLSECQPNSSPK
jgi:hypothetical protein